MGFLSMDPCLRRDRRNQGEDLDRALPAACLWGPTRAVSEGIRPNLPVMDCLDKLGRAFDPRHENRLPDASQGLWRPGAYPIYAPSRPGCLFTLAKRGAH